MTPPVAAGAGAGAALARSSYRALVRAIVNNPPRTTAAAMESTTTTTTTTRRACDDVDDDDDDAVDDAAVDAAVDAASPTPPTRLAISLRARGVLLDRVSAIVRDDASSSTVESFAASCVVATHFFRAAHADADSPEARHARAAVGYLDGVQRRARRLDANKGVVSKRASKAAKAKANVVEAWRNVLSASGARLVGLPRALIAMD